MGRQGILRWFLLVVGLLAVGLGIVGIVVPLLPTTPFLLLAAACFMRSSDRLYQRLIHHRWLGGYIRNYREHHAMTLQAKASALILLWGAIGYSALVVANTWWLRFLLGAVATGVTVHLLRLKTLARSGQGEHHADPEGTRPPHQDQDCAWPGGSSSAESTRRGPPMTAKP